MVYKLITVDMIGNAFNIEGLFKCLLGLSEREIQVFNHLLEHNGECCDKVAAELGISRSTVQRAMKRLYEIRLLVREQDFPAGQSKGYTYKYSLVPRDKLQAYLLGLVDNAASRMNALIKSEFTATKGA